VIATSILEHQVSHLCCELSVFLYLLH